MLRWLGHSCFLIGAGDELWLTDPFAPYVGYPEPKVEPTVVTISHGHDDHSYRGWLSSGATILEEGQELVRGDLKLQAISSFHDESMGQERGHNFIYRGETPRFTLAHLGDLGHALTKKQVETVGKVEILLLPIGGTYTIGPQEAWTVAEQVQPQVIVPMHYQTEALTFSLAGLDEFLQLAPQSWKIVEQEILDLDAELAKEQIVILKYS